MGQKVHPIGFRTGVIRTWSSVWFANKNYAQLLHEDLKLRDYIKKRLYSTQVARIDIERAGKKAKVHIYTARPGLVIGQRGAEVDKLRHELELLTGRELLINIHEVLTPELNAQLVSENIASQLERRIAFRRAMKKSMQNTIRLGALGVRLRVSGRLNGAEIARTEQSREGSVPLHTLRADVDYGQATAFTTYGTIGVKCWIYHGELAPGEMISGLSGDAEAGSRRRRGGGGAAGGGSDRAPAGRGERGS